MFGIWAILLIFSVISVVVLIAGGLSYSEESINVLSILKESVENRCFDKYMLGGYYPNESKNGAPLVVTRGAHLLDILLDQSHFQKNAILASIVFEMVLIVFLAFGIIYINKNLKAFELLKNFNRLESQIRFKIVKDENSEKDMLLTIGDIQRQR